MSKITVKDLRDYFNSLPSDRDKEFVEVLLKSPNKSECYFLGLHTSLLWDLVGSDSPFGGVRLFGNLLQPPSSIGKEYVITERKLR